ncbi:MAG: ABC transporter substrate-binding protein [Anaerolineales bacterium]|nr:ABC transporter substrate-binding protein [Anaerolineales bacterium]
MKAACTIALLLAGAGFFSGCGDAARRLRLVTWTELTGPHAQFGDGIRKAAGLALEEYREALEIAGWDVELAAYDARGPAQDFSAAVSRIASQPDVFCTVVHAGTARVFSALAPLRAAGIPAVFPAETAPLPDDDPLPGTLWLSPDDRIHGAADAEWTASNGFTGVFLLVESGAHSRAIADGYLERAKTLSLPVTQFQLSAEQYSSAWVLSFNDAAPPLVYFSGSTLRIPPLLQDLQQSGFTGSFFYAESLAEDLLPAPLVPDSIQFIFSPAAYHSENFFPDESFAEKYRAAYGSDPPPLSELGFDASALCLQPLLQRGSGDPILSAPRDAIRSAWQTGGAWEGLSGTYSLNGVRSRGTWVHIPSRDSITGRIPAPGFSPGGFENREGNA